MSNEAVQAAKSESVKKESAFSRWDDKMGAKHPELWKIVKWLIAGFIANVPELGVYMLCLRIFTSLGVTAVPNLFFFRFLAERGIQDPNYTTAALVYAYMISTAIGYAIAFVINRKATFHADQNVALSTFFYVLFVILTIFLNGLIGPVLSGLTSKLAFLPDTLVQIVSKFVGMLIPGLWAYPLNRFVIHRKKKPIEA
ncbi:MAG: hypothetical protein FWH26_10215 [Oscillospiraceae bacterium]|nr:hypothetical protein [Oscillospiraceae bacterium]